MGAGATRIDMSGFEFIADPIEAPTFSPELQLIYDTAPIGLAFLSTDCRYLNINQRLTEICGLPVADHLGRSVRETVPQVADQVEHIVHMIVRSGKPLTVSRSMANDPTDQI